MPVSLTRPSTRREHLSNWHDIRDYGATNSAACDSAIQEAFDAMDAADSSLNTPCTLYFPEGSWMTSRPIVMARNNLTVRGSGRGTTTIYQQGGYRHSLLVMGMTRRPGGTQFPAASHYTDAFGVMDSSFAPGANQRWGWKFDDSAVAFQGAAADLGAGGYESATQLTVSFALDSRGSYCPRGVVAGLGKTGWGVRPWAVFADGAGNYQFRFRTSEMAPADTSSVRSFSFAQGSANKGLHRVTICIDLVAGIYYAFVNKFQVATVAGYGTGGSGPSWTGGLKFERNYVFPFKVGQHGEIVGLGDALNVNPFPATLYGLWVGSTLRYANGAVGSSQTATDGTSMNDSDVYTKASTNNIFYLPMTDSPSGPFDGRLTSWADGIPGWWSGNGFWHTTGLEANGSNVQSDHRVCDLTLTLNGAKFGQALCLAAFFRGTVQDVYAIGGAHGIGSYTFGTSYPLTITDVVAQGDDACIFLSTTDYIDLERAELVSTACETPMKMLASQGRFQDILITGQLRGRYGIAIFGQNGYGGSWRFEGVYQDNEGYYFPTVADFYVEQMGGGNATNRVEIRNALMGTAGGRCAFLHVQELANGNGTETAGAKTPEVLIESVQVGSPRDAIMRTTGRLTTGTIEGPRPTDSATPWIKDASVAQVGTGMRVTTHKNIIPPSTVAWIAGSINIQSAPANPGMFARFACVKSGAYGTTNPPTWQGFDLVEATGRELGAFSTGQDSVVITGTYATSDGMFTAAVKVAELEFWLRGGSAPITSGSAYLAFSAKRNEVAEIGGGAFRAPVTAGTWSATSGRTVTNALAITWPAPGTYTATAESIFLADTGGHTIWIANLVNEITFATGNPAPVIPAGAITITK